VINPEALFPALLALIVLLDLVIVACQAALQRASLARLLALRDEMELPVRRAVTLLHDQFYAETGLNLALLLLRFLLAGVVMALFLPQGWSVPGVLTETGVLLLAALVLFGLQELMRGFISRNPETWLMRLAPLVRLLVLLEAPLLALPLAFNRGRAVQPDPALTEDELKSMVDAGHEDGVLEQDEREMIYSIFKLGDTLVREVMVPRIYITSLEADITLQEALDAMLASGYSRVPVYDDTIDNVIGLLYAKDLLRALREGSQVKQLRELVRPAYFVPEAKKVDELLDEMQTRRVHMALVVDEYGGIAGLVTLEDIVEEIVGEIRDEYDQAEEMPFQRISEDDVLFMGRVDLDDLNEVMHSALPKNEAETLGGYIYSRIGRVPEVGETLQVDDLTLTVEQVSGRRIRKVRVRRQPPDPRVEPEDVHVYE
jgi:CBS domain containing-hemolysin-like protein